MKLRFHTTRLSIQAIGCLLVAVGVGLLCLGEGFVANWLTEILPPSVQLLGAPWTAILLGAILITLPQLAIRYVRKHASGYVDIAEDYDAISGQAPILSRLATALLAVLTVLLLCGLIVRTGSTVQRAAVSQLGEGTARRYQARRIAEYASIRSVNSLWTQLDIVLASATNAEAPAPSSVEGHLITHLEAPTEQRNRYYRKFLDCRDASPTGFAKATMDVRCNPQDVESMADLKAVYILAARTLASTSRDGRLAKLRDTAAHLFDLALTIEPRDPVAQNGKGVCLRQKSDWTEATDWDLLATAFTAYDLAAANTKVAALESRIANNQVYLSLKVIYLLRVRNEAMNYEQLSEEQTKAFEALRRDDAVDSAVERIEALIGTAGSEVEEELLMTKAQALCLRAVIMSQQMPLKRRPGQSEARGTLAQATRAAHEALIDARLSPLRPKLREALVDPEAERRLVFGFWTAVPGGTAFRNQLKTLVGS